MTVFPAWLEEYLGCDYFSCLGKTWLEEWQGCDGFPCLLLRNARGGTVVPAWLEECQDCDSFPCLAGGVPVVQLFFLPVWTNAKGATVFLPAYRNARGVTVFPAWLEKCQEHG